MEMEHLRANLTKVRIPEPTNRIYKQECCISFDTPKSEGGLFVDMNTFLAFGKDYVGWNFEKTGNPVYLHIKQTKKPIPEDRPLKKPTLLAIGIDGGFDNQEPEYDETYSIVILPDYVTCPFPSVALPEKVRLAVDAILIAEGAERKEQVASWTADKKQISEHALTLKQIDNAVIIPPSGWKCAKCDKTENLWLNLTDGMILCGRKLWDGSGGNNHAIEHYNETRYPLAVKLGTITSDLEGADVFSYPEDESVTDPLLADHLAFFGIDFSSLQKTEMTTAEKELDQNTNFDWNRIQESGKEVEPVYGPGYTGLTNLGNSCYLAATMQVEDSYPFMDLAGYYMNQSLKQAFTIAPADPTVDLNMQLTAGLTSFPDYLVLHMRKFVMETGWVPKKLDVYVDVEDVIDISHMRSKGLQPGEELLPEEAPGGQEEPAKLLPNDDIVAQLASMGFNQLHCQKAAINTSNAGVEEAMNWLLSHMDDPDIDAPIDNKAKSNDVDPSKVATLVSFGFDEETASKALKASGGDIEKATDWIFNPPAASGPSDMDATSSSGPTVDAPLPDGSGKYRLIGLLRSGNNGPFLPAQGLMAKSAAKSQMVVRERGMKVTCQAASIPADNVPDMEKRKLMNLLLLGALGLPTAGMLYPYTYFLVPPGSGGGGGGTPAKDALGNDIIAAEWIKTHGPGDRTLSQGLKGDPTYLVVENDRTLATYGINAVCTHLGCVVPWNKAENKFMCPCHGSQYNNQGKVVRGPAPLSLALAHADVSLDDGKVVFVPWTETDFRTGDAPWWS
ncbi:ubiquitin carboxyl-terminal hydrolase 14 isoform X1 [Tanacetum coccineum]|uniref:Ubiquitin carboxyl-terminal hydrolase 14 isoform X1 n=1 Tax=Tanacetum coccineum TaxID=301880 RepID=A0ABQ5D7K4_9ASTR